MLSDWEMASALWYAIDLNFPLWGKVDTPAIRDNYMALQHSRYFHQRFGYIRWLKE